MKPLGSRFLATARSFEGWPLKPAHDCTKSVWTGSKRGSGSWLIYSMNHSFRFLGIGLMIWLQSISPCSERMQNYDHNPEFRDCRSAFSGSSAWLAIVRLEIQSLNHGFLSVPWIAGLPVDHMSAALRNLGEIGRIIFHSGPFYCMNWTVQTKENTSWLLGSFTKKYAMRNIDFID
jgi:hypothetical protein